MIHIRILALDLDGTLLHSDLSISVHTKNAVKKVEDHGIVLVLASGRNPKSMEEYARSLDIFSQQGYLICNNGAIIKDAMTGNVICESMLSPETALSICDLAEAEGFPVQIYDDGIMYVSRANNYSGYYVKETGARQVVVENFREMVASGCHKLIVPGEPEFLASLEQIIRTYEKDISILMGKQNFMEIHAPGTNKGSALAIIADALGIDRGDVMAIGNSTNDEAMIRWAGYGVAMLNSVPELKKIAKIVTSNSNDNDGVADFINNYILRGK